MATQFGLTPTGFIPKQQQDVISEIQSALQLALGQNINLLPQSAYGQIVGIFSEREALLWQLAEAVYASQYPSGAEGTSVDNILALNNIGRRLPARATKTAPTNTLGVPGLVLYGTAGTVIPVGSIISVQGNAALQFTTDATATVAPAVNAVQLLTPYGGIPTTGSFTIRITAPSGTVLTSFPVQWNANAATTRLSWATPPASGAFILALNNSLTASIPFGSLTSAGLQTAIQAIPAYATATVSGTVGTEFLINWGTVAQPVVAANSTKLSFSANPSAGSLQISVGGTSAAAVAYNATAAALQTAIRALVGYSGVSVSGSATSATGFFINWGTTAPATVLVVTQPTGATVTVVDTNTLDQTTTVVNSIQSAINTLFDSFSNNSPYTDVVVAGSFSSALFTASFGAQTPTAGQPSSGSQAQNLFTVPSNSLLNGSTVVNMNFVTSTAGLPAQAVVGATCTQVGPNFVPAGFLTVIGSPVGGWTSVTNPLDCITGSNLETDTEALARRETLLASQANGPIQAIVEKVAQVAGVSHAIGFENTSLASNQTLTFSGTPTAGSFNIAFKGPTGITEITNDIPFVTGIGLLANVQVLKFSAVPTGGYFTLTFGTQTTAHISFSATASDVQLAIQALTGYEHVIVTGSFALNFTLAFSIRTQLPMSATNSLVGATITAVASVQSYINELPSYDLVTVTGSVSANFTLAFNGSAGGQGQQLVDIINGLTGVSSITPEFGLPGKSFEIVVDDNNGQASDLNIAGAIYASKPAGIRTFGTVISQITDAFGNPYLIQFSRPTQVPFYVLVALQTDLTASSTPKFNPQSILTLQQDIVAIGSKVPIGGLVVGFGTDGLIGAFNSIPGILSYSLFFGTAPNPTTNTNVQLQSEQVAQFETFLVQVSYT